MAAEVVSLDDMKQILTEAEVMVGEDGDATIDMGAVEILNAERTAIYKSGLSDKIEEDAVLLSCYSDDTDFQHIVKVNGDEAEEVRTECKIMYEELPLPAMIEYKFEDGVWRLSTIGEDACEHYRGSKFENWEKNMKNPTCAAGLRRMCEIGLITTLFDHLAFPNPPGTEDQFVVQDDHGKDVNIPHPVEAMRYWDKQEDAYVDFNCRLVGSPTVEDEQTYWDSLMAELHENFPEDMETIDKAIQK